MVVQTFGKNGHLGQTYGVNDDEFEHLSNFKQVIGKNIVWLISRHHILFLPQ